MGNRKKRAKMTQRFLVWAMKRWNYYQFRRLAWKGIGWWKWAGVQSWQFRVRYLLDCQGKYWVGIWLYLLGFRRYIWAESWHHVDGIEVKPYMTENAWWFLTANSSNFMWFNLIKIFGTEVITKVENTEREVYQGWGLETVSSRMLEERWKTNQGDEKWRKRNCAVQAINLKEKKERKRNQRIQSSS